MKSGNIFLLLNNYSTFHSPFILSLCTRQTILHFQLCGIPLRNKKNLHNWNQLKLKYQTGVKWLPKLRKYIVDLLNRTVLQKKNSLSKSCGNNHFSLARKSLSCHFYCFSLHFVKRKLWWKHVTQSAWFNAWHICFWLLLHCGLNYGFTSIVIYFAKQYFKSFMSNE